MALTVVPLSDFSEWQKWKPAWDDLLKNSVAFEARVFLSFEWLTTWWQHLGRGRLLVVNVAEGERLLAAAPLFISHSPLLPFARIIRFIGNGNADYGDFSVRRNYEDAGVIIWDWLVKQRSLWNLIALHELPEGSIALSSLSNFSLPKWVGTKILTGEPYHRITFDAQSIPSCPFYDPNGSFGWRKRATKALQKQLRRRERQIFEKFDAKFHIVSEPDEIPTAMAKLFALHRLRWAGLGQTGVFMSPKVKQFHIDFAQKALKRGWLRLHSLMLNGEIAASYYAFHHNDYSGFYSCGFYPKFARYSVGKVLLAKVIDEAEKEGASLFDFMRGGEAYKSEFGTNVGYNRHLFIWQKDETLSRICAYLDQLITKMTLKVKNAVQR